MYVYEYLTWMSVSVLCYLHLTAMNFIRLKKFGACPKFHSDFTYANHAFHIHSSSKKEDSKIEGREWFESNGLNWIWYVNFQIGIHFHHMVLFVSLENHLLWLIFFSVGFGVATPFRSTTEICNYKNKIKWCWVM